MKGCFRFQACTFAVERAVYVNTGAASVGLVACDMLETECLVFKTFVGKAKISNCSESVVQGCVFRKDTRVRAPVTFANNDVVNPQKKSRGEGSASE